MPTAVASQWVVEMTPNVPLISGLVVNIPVYSSAVLAAARGLRAKS